MTRYVVFREGTEPYPGTIVARNALKPRPHKFIPVVWANDSGKIIGKATDFERDDSGAISFEIEFDPKFPENLDEVAGEESFSVYAIDLIQGRTGEKATIFEATIMMIYFIPLPGFPKAKNSQDLQAS